MRKLCWLGGSVVLFLGLTTSVTRAGLEPGYLTLVDGHTDLAIEFDDGFTLGVGRDDDDPPAFYLPDQVLLFAGQNTQTIQPADPQFGFLGAGVGHPIWVLPEAAESDRLFLGLGAEDIAPGTFASWTPPDKTSAEWLQIDLLGVSGPGQFAIWQSDVFGGPMNELSTAAGRTTIYHLAGGHAHYNWSFTAPGDYDVSLRVTGYSGPEQTDPVTSDVTTYHFRVVPEPGALMLGAMGAIAAAVGIAGARRRTCQAMK